MTNGEHALRCPFCETGPQLAGYGIDESGRLFIHVLVYKANKRKADIYIHGGSVTLGCPKCGKFHRVNIKQTQVTLERTRKPVLSK